MIGESDLAHRAHELEDAVQQEAFQLLRRDGSYARAQDLIIVASDIHRIRIRLAELLEQPKTSAVAQGDGASEKSVRSSRKLQGKYPYFFVADDRVVKIGKGKQKSAKEYRHEATRTSFDHLARWIESQTLEGQREWLAKDADTQLQDKAPAYQTYLLIAALSSVGVLHQVKRGLYRLDTSAGGPVEWWARLGALPSPSAKG